MSTEEDRIWDAEQDYAALGPRPFLGYPPETEEEQLPTKSRETPIFKRLADDQWPEHAINRMRRAEAVKANDATGRGRALIHRETAAEYIFGGMYTADEHDPNL